MNKLKWILFLMYFALSTEIYGQANTNPEKRSFEEVFSINLEYGWSVPALMGGQSLDITSQSTEPEAVSNFLETKDFTESIEPGVVLGLEAAYQIKPWISMGIGAQYRDNYDHFAEMNFTQEKLILSNDLNVSSLGTYQQRSYIRNTTLTANANLNFLKINLGPAREAIFELGLGGGASFFKINSSAPAVFLKMDVENDLVNGSYILGPGSIKQDTVRTTSFAWKASANLSLKRNEAPRVKIGFRMGGLGNFILMERTANDNPIMNLTSTNSGSSDLELSLVSTNNQRSIIAKEFFVKIFLWWP